MAGIKETKEVIRAVVISGAFIGERLKDGPDLGDVFAIPTWLVRNQADLRAGFEQIKDVPAEIKDLTSEYIFHMLQK